MTVDTDSSWRLRVRQLADPDRQPGDVVGAGFAVTSHEALTCAHVIGTATECWVETLGGDHAAQLSRVQALQTDGIPGDPSADIAVISLPNAVPSAPLGPPNPPAMGTELQVLGYPYPYPNRHREQLTRARVAGAPTNGLIQVDGLYEHARIVAGYSGSAAVDIRSGRVVGMVVESEINHSSRVAWIIPLATIAQFWTPLNLLLPKSLSVDPEFCRAVEDLKYGAYQNALRRLNSIFKDYPGEADMYYYRALAALGGRRPGGYTGPTVEAIVRLLEAALLLNPDAAHVAALLALVDEDYYQLRGLRPASYSEPRQIRPDHVREILRHVPAPECPTWQYLSRSI